MNTLTRLEEGQKALDQQFETVERHVSQRIDDLGRRVDQRFDAVSREIAELRQIMLWGFGVMFAGMFALTGFVLWDRRTALAPAIDRVERGIGETRAAA